MASCEHDLYFSAQDQVRPLRIKQQMWDSHIASDWLYLSISLAFSSNTKNFCSVGLDRYASHKMSHLLDLANEKAGLFIADQSEVSGEL